jgi:excisionase family DNA binding protein
MNRLYTVEEAADILRLKPKTLRNWISARKIPFLKIGGSVRLSEQQLQEIIQGSEMRPMLD